MNIITGRRNKTGISGGDYRPRIMAHRGASGVCPENTLVSFNKAIEDGADVLEMDVRLTADLQVVVMHDAMVDRTTDGAGLVSTLSLGEIQELDAGYHFTPDGGITLPFRGKRIVVPTFEQVLDAFPQVPINVEIKDNNPVLVERTKELLEKYRRFQDGNVLVAADSPSLMRLIRRQMPAAITGFSRTEVYSFLTTAWLGLSSLYGWPGQALQIPVKHGLVPVMSTRVIKAAHRLNLAVHVWTANTQESIQGLVNLGVDGVFTDFPQLMRRTLEAGKQF